MAKPHRHLTRLDRVWLESPTFLITTVTRDRHSGLATPEAASILIEEWKSGAERRNWQIARYTIMPDHVHFFCSPGQNPSSLEALVCHWKEWTSKRLTKEQGFPTPVWGNQFHDHLIRNEESCVEKWDYVYRNPVRAGLVRSPEDWKFSGTIHAMSDDRFGDE